MKEEAKELRDHIERFLLKLVDDKQVGKDFIVMSIKVTNSANADAIRRLYEAMAEIGDMSKRLLFVAVCTALMEELNTLYKEGDKEKENAEEESSIDAAIQQLERQLKKEDKHE